MKRSKYKRLGGGCKMFRVFIRRDIIKNVNLQQGFRSRSLLFSCVSQLQEKNVEYYAKLYINLWECMSLDARIMGGGLQSYRGLDDDTT